MIFSARIGDTEYQDINSNQGDTILQWTKVFYLSKDICTRQYYVSCGGVINDLKICLWLELKRKIGSCSGSFTSVPPQKPTLLKFNFQ